MNAEKIILISYSVFAGFTFGILFFGWWCMSSRAAANWMRKVLSKYHIPCKPGEVSDGFHTFDELYDHRCTLFLALMKAHPSLSWISTKHADGTALDGWFIAGMRLPTGEVTYHLPRGMWLVACETGATVLERGHAWDGHTSADVVKRLQGWLYLLGTTMDRDKARP